MDCKDDSFDWDWDGLLGLHSATTPKDNTPNPNSHIQITDIATIPISAFNINKDTILIDLGNVHDCIQPIIDNGLIDKYNVIAFADEGFNGLGVNPRTVIPVVQASTPRINAADYYLALAVILLSMLSPNNQRHFYIATKDKGIHGLEEIAKHYGHVITFAVDWNKLKSCL